MTTTLVTDTDLGALLARRDFATLQRLLSPLPPADLARSVAALEADEAARVVAALPPAVAARAFGYFDPELQLRIARALPRVALQQLFRDMPHDERADLWKNLPEDERDAILPGLAAAEREDIRRLASYPEGTAGSIMSSDYAVLSPELTAAQAIDRLRAEAPDRETIYDAYVIDADRRLVGVVSLRDLLLAPPDRRVADIMTREVVFVRVDDPREAVAETIAQYDLLAVPVVNGGDALVGIVTVDDALDVAQTALARRLTQFGGTASLGGPDIDVVRSPFREMFSKRVFWLILLTFFGILTSTFVANQEALLEEAIILAAFVAPIIDMGGNTGSQSATLVIRAMALGQVKLRWRDFAFLLKRDLPVAAALGVTIALLEAVLAHFSKAPGADVLLVVGLSMLVVTVVGSLVGLVLPFIGRALKADPATLSAPTITSVMDLLGVFIYFGFAYAFLGDQLIG
ncbi:MAG: magnesium transporter [Sphingomonadaceae bacterium]|uniref:magnesium transporter n=1 Tax=Thermaurantiacus sp. TaxID=2820283 RepID=UPI00298F0AFD|nr:magnesium transporter [Thermaurantiacus sp.]MCS6986031.1 magnesium transporter [Sphingomonadaceae bacterium]MDW8414753.1 magnesium transporter [Thermaurantiacus sp.]